jgi:hypothetical protein
MSEQVSSIAYHNFINTRRNSTTQKSYKKSLEYFMLFLKVDNWDGQLESDPKTKLQARAIASDCYKYIMDLTTNGVVVTDATRHVQSKVDHLNAASSEKKQLLLDIREDIVEPDKATQKKGLEEQEKEKTHNGIF